ncbi:uncharacterized protein LOC122372300 [Amphibalanus amphitrite]|uniref:uncharacterized protein LOC122372300 n=1 Tax=Amphibalanus amphitrite TaxID=1232801 RepID=UPI001C915831|nr:uncharacterized protein LOC122372300 [Amphibalanus amphitrite]
MDRQRPAQRLKPAGQAHESVVFPENRHEAVPLRVTPPWRPPRQDFDGCPGNTTDWCACPAGFSRCAGRCLSFLSQKTTFAEGQAACAALGAHLAVPRTEAENQCVTDLSAAAANAYAWLGVQLVEGVWVGTDASAK